MRKHIRINLLLLLAALFASPLFGGTLLDQNGDRMRATPMIIGGASGLTNSVNYATDYNNWITLRDVYKLNTVRLCWVDPYYEDHGWPHWTLSQAAPYIDQCVQNAANAGMNIIINYHNTAENQQIKDQFGNVIAPIDLTRNQQERIDFWTLMASSYANDSHVYFELVNEPVWSYGFYTDTVFKNNLLDVYEIVDTLAPNREILLFSFHNMIYSDYSGNNNQSLRAIADNYSASGVIDWSKTTVAFHGYFQTSSAPITALMNAGYRVYCTEWDYPGTHPWVPPSIDGELVNAQTWERLEISWADWRNFADYDLNPSSSQYVYHKFDTVLLNDATAKGYWWGGSTGGGPGGGDLTGTYRIKCSWGGEYMSGDGSASWTDVRTGPLNTSWGSMKWDLERVSGNTYRIKCQWGGEYLSGIGDQTWQTVRTGPLNTAWNSMKWELEHVSGNSYRIRCLWGNQYLFGDGAASWQDVVTAPLDTSWSAQIWELEEVQ